MIEDENYPVLENPTVDQCYATHVTNKELYPFFSTSFGMMTANSDKFKIIIKVNIYI